MNVTARFASALFALAGLASCAPALPAGGAMRVDCNLTDATVWIDDVPMGNTSTWKAEGHQIRAGFHRVEVRRPGYYSVFKEVDLPAGGQALVVAKLRETID